MQTKEHIFNEKDMEFAEDMKPHPTENYDLDITDTGLEWDITSDKIFFTYGTRYFNIFFTANQNLLLNVNVWVIYAKHHDRDFHAYLRPFSNQDNIIDMLCKHLSYWENSQ